MEMAVAIGDCTRDDADLLRRAMGSKRGIERIESIKETLYAGMARQRARRRGRRRRSTCRSSPSRTSASPRATRSASRCSSTPARGSSCTTRRRSWPALLRAQPMGFYSPQSLVQDARRHGVEVLRPDIVALRRAGRARAAVAESRSDAGLAGLPRRRTTSPRRTTAHDPDPTPDPPSRRGVRRPARARRGPRDRRRRRRADRRCARRSGRSPTWSTSPAGPGWTPASSRRWRRPGVFEVLGAVASGGAVERRLHRARGPARGDAGRRSPAPMLPGMDPVGETLADLWATRISPDVAPDRAPAPTLRRGRDQVGRPTGDGRGRPPGARRRAGHPPAATGHGRGSHLPQPRGRDRDAQRDLHPGVWRRYRKVARNGGRHGDPRDARAPRRRHQPARRQDRPARGRHPEAERALRARHRSRDFQ